MLVEPSGCEGEERDRAAVQERSECPYLGFSVGSRAPLKAHCYQLTSNVSLMSFLDSMLIGNCYLYVLFLIFTHDLLSTNHISDVT